MVQTITRPLRFVAVITNLVHFDYASNVSYREHRLQFETSSILSVKLNFADFRTCMYNPREKFDTTTS